MGRQKTVKIKKEKKYQVHIKLHAEQKRYLEAIAKAKDTSLNKVITEAFSLYIAHYENTEGEIPGVLRNQLNLFDGEDTLTLE